MLRLGAQSGETTSGGYPPEGGQRSYGTTYGQPNERGEQLFTSSTGTAARFFFNSDWMAERLEAAEQVGYHAKASRAEREAGLDPRTLALLGLDEIDESGEYHTAYGEFAGIPGTKHTPNTRREFEEATINDGRAKSIDNPYQRGETTRRNIHATVKPISLARWLATLLLPPPEYGPRRLLVPFAGVASEMIGAMLAGWEDVEGIELGADHVEIGRARLAYWQQRRYELLDPAAPLTVKAAPKAPRGQMDMFFEEKAA